MKELPVPKATSMGATIVRCSFKEGSDLGADTKVNEGPNLAGKNINEVCDATISVNRLDAAVQEGPLMENSLLP
jgi:hypothetical protein